MSLNCRSARYLGKQMAKAQRFSYGSIRNIAEPEKSELGQNLFHDVCFFHSCQPHIKPLELVRKSIVIDAEQVQHGRVHIMNRNNVFHGIVAQLVRGSV